MLYKYQMSYINVIQLSQNPFRSQFFCGLSFTLFPYPELPIKQPLWPMVQRATCGALLNCMAHRIFRHDVETADLIFSGQGT